MKHTFGINGRIFFVSLFIFAGGVLFLRQSPQSFGFIPGGVGKFLLSPQVANLPLNQDTTIDVMINTGTVPISGAALRLTFPNNNEIAVVSFEPSVALPTGWTYPIKTDTTANGTTTLELAGAFFTTTGYTTNNTNVVFAKITLRALQNFTNKNIEFTQSVTKITRKSDGADIVGTTTGGTYNGGNGASASPSPAASASPQVSPSPSPSELPSPTPSGSPAASASPTVSPSPTASPSPASTASVTLQIRLQGVTVQRANQTIGIKLQKNNTTVYDQNLLFISGSDGLYTNTQPIVIAPDSYTIFLRGPLHLIRALDNLPVLEGVNNFNLSLYPLLTGDIFDNERIDIFDYSQIVAHFGPTNFPAGGSPADLDFDSDVDIYDYSYFVSNFDLRGDL